jgi:hypothetical protein
MSPAAEGALIGGGIGLLSLTINLFFNSRARKEERAEREAERRAQDREWYRRTLFDKRIAALQQAKVWLNRLSDVMYNPESASHIVPIDEALDWYQSNILFIHGEMPEVSPVGSFLYSTKAMLDIGDEMPDESMWDEASRFVRRKANELVPKIDV